MSDYPVLVKDGEERTPETITEFVQLNYDGWAKKDPDAVVPNSSEGEGQAAAEQNDPPTPPALPAGQNDDGPPPQWGKGSGSDEWRAYANRVGVDVDGLDKREDIVEAISAAGHPVDPQ